MKKLLIALCTLVFLGLVAGCSDTDEGGERGERPVAPGQSAPGR